MDDLARHGLDILTLRDRGSRTKVAALVADQIEWIRELLHKGWPLCEELSWYRGRLLAFWLRQQAAQLSALEQAGYDLFAPRRRAGWLGILACLGASVLTRSAPPFAR